MFPYQSISVTMHSVFFSLALKFPFHLKWFIVKWISSVLGWERREREWAVDIISIELFFLSFVFNLLIKSRYSTNWCYVSNSIQWYAWHSINTSRSTIDLIDTLFFLRTKTENRRTYLIKISSITVDFVSFKYKIVCTVSFGSHTLFVLSIIYLILLSI